MKEVEPVLKEIIKKDLEWGVYSFIVVVSGTILILVHNTLFVLIFLLISLLGFFLLIKIKKNKEQILSKKDFKILFETTGQGIGFKMIEKCAGNKAINYTDMAKKLKVGANIVRLYYNVLRSRDFFINDYDFKLSRKGRLAYQIMKEIKDSKILEDIQNKKKISNKNAILLALKFGFVKKIKLNNRTSFDLTKLGSNFLE